MGTVMGVLYYTWFETWYWIGRIGIRVADRLHRGE